MIPTTGGSGTSQAGSFNIPCPACLREAGCGMTVIAGRVMFYVQCLSCHRQTSEYHAQREDAVKQWQSAAPDEVLPL